MLDPKVKLKMAFLNDLRRSNTDNMLVSC